jgi:ATP-dependent Lhr-like helicase
VEREWCDGGAAAASSPLLALRREIEPGARGAGPLPAAWHGVGLSSGGLDRLAEVIAQLEGLPLPASVLERDILPARVRGYHPRLLDELGAAGEVAWVGIGTLGKDDGRIALVRPDRLALYAGAAASDVAGEGAAGVTPGADADDAWLPGVLREHLVARGASFYRDLLAARAPRHAAAPPRNGAAGRDRGIWSGPAS